VQLIDEAGGIDKIEALQNHPQDNVHQKALTLIDTYFGHEDEAAYVGPAATGPGMMFNPGAAQPPQAGLFFKSIQSVIKAIKTPPQALN